MGLFSGESQLNHFVLLSARLLFVVLAPLRQRDPYEYRGTSLTRKCAPLESYRRPVPRVLAGS